MTSRNTNPPPTPAPALIPAPKEFRIPSPGSGPAEFYLPPHAPPLKPKGPRKSPIEIYAWARLLETLRAHAPETASMPKGQRKRTGHKRSTWFIVERSTPEWSSNDNAYELVVSESGVRVVAGTPQAILYAVQTLRQLIIHYGHYGPRLPHLEIRDEPAYNTRGVMHDVSRGKVPRRQTLLDLVDTLSFFKINQLQLYVEHTFAFKKHPLPGRGHSPLTTADIRAVGQRCTEAGIEFVPCLQSLGHMHHFLKHPRYAHLAESDFRGGWTASPAVPETYELLKDLYEDFLPSFPPGKSFNICCDEPWDLGRGKSAPRAKDKGLAAVYLDHIEQIHALTKGHGREPLIWGDVVQNHPELLDKLPRNIPILHWGYETKTERARQTKALEKLRRSGREFWVCPGTSAWNSLFFRKANAADNLRWMAEAGHKAGAKGYLITDWGDNGHYNFLGNSLWPFAYGAECAWNAGRAPVKTRTRESTFDKTFSRLIFGAEHETFREALNLLGGLYLDFGVIAPNHSPERWLLTGPPPEEEDLLSVGPQVAAFAKAKLASLREAERNAARAVSLLENVESGTLSSETVRAEWLLAARLARHACKRALWLIEKGKRTTGPALARELEALTKDFQALWLARNKKSDLGDNLETLERVKKGYRP